VTISDGRVILEARGLGMAFRNGAEDLQVLAGIDLAVGQREFVCVVGPSGCGKTTLLRLLAGLIRPRAGQVLFDGQPLTQPRRRIGFVFQQANLMPWRTVVDNITLPLELQGVARAVKEARASELIELVGLQGFEHNYPSDLSGGMAQRVAIARALIHEPDLLLLDEPFGSLDALTRERMAEELMRIWGRKPVTVVMVTHSIPEAILMADRVLALGPRPAVMRLSLSVPLPRPRTLHMTYSEQFGELAEALRASIT
jgi:NitT/TauT family transport system ATP-binding protein